MFQKEPETPELVAGAVKAIRDLYDVMRYDIMSINMRSVITTHMDWNVKYNIISIMLFILYFPIERTMRPGICFQKREMKAVYFQH